MMKKTLLLLCFLCSFFGVSAQHAMDGVWTGKLNVGPQTLTLVLHVAHEASGNAVCSLDSPDQGAMNIPVKSDYCSADSISISLEQLGLAIKAG